jgi:hypothetical protein
MTLQRCCTILLMLALSIVSPLGHFAAPTPMHATGTISRHGWLTRHKRHQFTGSAARKPLMRGISTDSMPKGIIDIGSYILSRYRAWCCSNVRSEILQIGQRPT